MSAILKIRGTITVPVTGGEEARLHSRLTLMMLKPGGPPKLGLQLDARVSKGVADVNARKERARGSMAENIITEEMKVELSGECEGDVWRSISNNEGVSLWYLYSTERQCSEGALLLAGRIAKNAMHMSNTMLNPTEANGAERIDEIEISKAKVKFREQKGIGA